MKVKTILLAVFLSAGYLPHFFQPAYSATVTHIYDELNRLVQTVYDTGHKVTTTRYIYDPAGNILEFTVSPDQLLGDVDNNGVVDLVDAVLCLQIAVGATPSLPIHRDADIDGDNQLGVVELIFILRSVAGLE